MLIIRNFYYILLFLLYNQILVALTLLAIYSDHECVLSCQFGQLFLVCSRALCLFAYTLRRHITLLQTFATNLCEEFVFSALE